MIDKLHRNDLAKGQRHAALNQSADVADDHEDQQAAGRMADVAIDGDEQKADAKKQNGVGRPPDPKANADVMEMFREVNGDVGRGKPPDPKANADVMNDFREVNGDIGRGKPPDPKANADVMEMFREVNGEPAAKDKNGAAAKDKTEAKNDAKDAKDANNGANKLSPNDARLQGIVADLEGGPAKPAPNDARLQGIVDDLEVGPAKPAATDEAKQKANGVGRPPDPKANADVMNDFREVNGDIGRGKPPDPKENADVMQMFREVNAEPAKDEKKDAKDGANQLSPNDPRLQGIVADLEVGPAKPAETDDAKQKANGVGKPPSAESMREVMNDFREVNGDIGRGKPPDPKANADVMEMFREVNGEPSTNTAEKPAPAKLEQAADVKPDEKKGEANQPAISNHEAMHLLQAGEGLLPGNPVTRLAQVAIDDAESKTTAKKKTEDEHAPANPDANAAKDAAKDAKDPAKTDSERHEAKEKAAHKKEEAEEKESEEQKDHGKQEDEEDKHDDEAKADKKTGKLIAGAKAVSNEKAHAQYSTGLDLKTNHIDGAVADHGKPNAATDGKHATLTAQTHTQLLASGMNAVDGKHPANTNLVHTNLVDGHGTGVDIPGMQKAPDGNHMGQQLPAALKHPNKEETKDESQDQVPLQDSEGNSVDYTPGQPAPQPKASKGAAPGGFAKPKKPEPPPAIKPNTPTQEAMQAYIDKARADRDAQKGAVQAQKLQKCQAAQLDGKALKDQIAAKNNQKLAEMRAKAEKDKAAAAKKAEEDAKNEGPVTVESLQKKLDDQVATDKEKLKTTFEAKKSELTLRMQTQRETLQQETQKQIDNWKTQQAAQDKQLAEAWAKQKEQWDLTAKNLQEQMTKQVAADKERLDKEKITLEKKTQERMNELDAKAKANAAKIVSDAEVSARGAESRANGLAAKARTDASAKAAGVEDEGQKSSIIADGNRRAAGLEVTGKNDAKKIRDEAKKTSDGLIEKGKTAREAANRVAINQVKAIDDKIGQLKGLADERIKKAAEDLRAKREAGEKDLKAKLEASKKKIDELKQKGEEKIAKLEADALPKLQAEYDRDLAAIDNKVKVAQAALKNGNAKNLAYLKTLVTQTCTAIDKTVNDAEKNFDKVINTAESQAQAFILAQLAKIKAEADKALEEIDRTYDESLQRLKDVSEQVHHDIEELSKGKMLEVEVHTATLLADLGDKSKLEACRATIKAYLDAGRPLPQGYAAVAAPEPEKDKDGKPIEPKKEEKGKDEAAIEELTKLDDPSKKDLKEKYEAKDGKDAKDKDGKDKKAEPEKSPEELEKELNAKVDAEIKKAQTQTGAAAFEATKATIDKQYTDADASMKKFVKDTEVNQDAIFKGDEKALEKADAAVKAKEQGEKAAKDLDDAMRGLGTDEKKIFATLKGKSPEEIAAIKEAYKLKTGRDLEADLLDELSGDDLKEARALLSANKTESRVAAIQNSFGTWGTDKNKIKEALNGPPPLSEEERKELAARFKIETGRELNEVLADTKIDGVNPADFMPPAPPPIAAEELAKEREANLESNKLAAEKLMNATCGDKLGTDEAAVMKALAGKTPAQIAVIKEEFQKLTGRSLDAVLVDEMSGAELKEAMATMSGDPVQIAVAKLDNAAHGGIMPGTDLGKINETLEGIKDPETRKKVKEEYERQTGQKLDEMLDDELSGFDRDLAKAYAGGNPEEIAAVKADKAMHGGFLTDIADGLADTVGDATGVTPEERQKLREKMREGVGTAIVGVVAGPFAPFVYGLQAAGVNIYSTDMGTDEKALYEALESCPDEYSRQKLREEYKKRTGKDLDVELKGELSGAEGDVAKYIMEGDQVAAEAAKMKAAGQGASTDKKMIYDALEKCKTEEERKKLIAKYNELYGGNGENFDQMLKNELAPSTASTLGWGAIGFVIGGPAGAAFMASGQNDLDYQKAKLLSEGKMDDGFAAYYAMNEGLFGAGTDDDALKKIVKGPPQKTKAEIEVLKKQYAEAAKKYGGKDNADLFDDMMDETSGRTAHDLEVGMMGKPETPEEMKKIEKMNVDFERNDNSWVGEVGMFIVLGPVGYGIAKAMGVKANDVGNALTDSWSSSGENLDKSHADFEAKWTKLQNDPRFADRLKFPPGSPERIAMDKAMMDELEGSLARSEGNLEDFKAAKDATAEVAGQVVAVAVGAVLTIASGGTLGPAVIALISGMSGLGATMMIKGGAMSNEEIGQQLAQTVASAMAAGLVDIKAVKGLIQSAGALAGGSEALAGKIVEEMVQSAISSGSEALINAVIDPANYKGGPADWLMNVTAATAKAAGTAAFTGAITTGLGGKWDPNTLGGKMLKGTTMAVVGGAAGAAIDPATYEGSQDEKWGRFAKSQAQGVVQALYSPLGEKDEGHGHKEGEPHADGHPDAKPHADAHQDAHPDAHPDAKPLAHADPKPDVHVDPALKPHVDAGLDQAVKAQPADIANAHANAKTQPMDQHPAAHENAKTQPLEVKQQPHENTKTQPLDAHQQPHENGKPIDVPVEHATNQQHEDPKPKAIEEPKPKTVEEAKKVNDDKKAEIKEQSSKQAQKDETPPPLDAKSAHIQGVDKGPANAELGQQVGEARKAQRLHAEDPVRVQDMKIDQMFQKDGKTPMVTPSGAKNGYGIRQGFDAQRVAYDHGNVMEITIRVHLDATHLMHHEEGPIIPATHDQLAKMKADTHAGVDQHYNDPNHKLPNGDVLRVKIEFVDDPNLAHLQVKARAGEGRADQKNWYVDSNGTVHAHELGHQLGLLDEYHDPKAINRKDPTSPGVHNDKSLMGNFWIPATDPATGKPILNPDGTKKMIPDPATALKKRHLEQIQADIDARRQAHGVESLETKAANAKASKEALAKLEEMQGPADPKAQGEKKPEPAKVDPKQQAALKQQSDATLASLEQKFGPASPHHDEAPASVGQRAGQPSHEQTPTEKPRMTPHELAIDAQQRANLDRASGITPKQRETFDAIDQLAKSAKTKDDWAYIRHLEAQEGRPVSERFSHNDEMATLQASAREKNITAEQQSAVKKQQSELTPEVKAKQEAHNKAVEQLTADTDRSIKGKDDKVTQQIADKANASQTVNGRKEVSVDAAISLGMGGAGAAGAKGDMPAGHDTSKPRTDRIGIEDASKPELWRTLGHKEMGQEASAISYGKDGVRTSDVAEHGTAMPAKASELALQVAAQRDASGVGTVGSQGPVGPLEYKKITMPDGKVVLEVGVPTRMQTGVDAAGKPVFETVLIKTTKGVDVSTGMGPARELSTHDSPDGSRKAQISPEHAEQLKKGRSVTDETGATHEKGPAMMSGEAALAMKADSFKGERVLGIGGGPTSEWAMEHALNGGAKSVEVAGQMPKPKPGHSPLGNELATLETTIRAHVDRGETVPPELTKRHQEIITEHVANQRGRLEEIKQKLADGSVVGRAREKLQQEQARIHGEIDPFLGSRVDRNHATLNNDKITHVQADVIKVRPIVEDGGHHAIEVTYADGTTRVVDRVIPSIGANPDAPGGIHQIVKNAPPDMQLIPVISEGRCVGLESNPPGITISGAAMVGTLGHNMPPELMKRIPADMRDAVVASVIDHAYRDGVSGGSRGIVPGIENVGSNPQLTIEAISKIPREQRSQELQDFLDRHKARREAGFEGHDRFPELQPKSGTIHDRLQKLNELERMMESPIAEERARAIVEREKLANNPEFQDALKVREAERAQADEAEMPMDPNKRDEMKRKFEEAKAAREAAEKAKAQAAESELDNKLAATGATKDQASRAKELMGGGKHPAQTQEQALKNAAEQGPLASRMESLKEKLKITPKQAAELAKHAADANIIDKINKLLDHAGTGEYKNPENLKLVLDAIGKGSPQHVQALEDALRRIKSGSTDVKIEAEADVVDDTTKQSVQHKRVSGGPDQMGQNLQDALWQLTGAGGEKPPADHTHVAHLDMQPKTKQFDMNGPELQQELQAMLEEHRRTVKGTDPDANPNAKLDGLGSNVRILITNKHGTFEFEGENFTLVNFTPA